MRYYYKKPGAWTWTQYDTDSLEADVAAGRVGTDWRIHREGESTQYLASELIAVEAAAKDQRPQQKEKVPADIGKSAAAAEPFLRTTKMQKTRPLAVTLIAIWSFLAGSLIIFGGLSLLLEYANAIQRSETDSLVNSWLPYFRFYGGVGVLWVLAGLGLCISTFGLWSGSAWGRILDLLCYAGVVVGWVIIWFVSRSFRLPEPLIYLIVALPMFFLFAGKTRNYFMAEK